MEAKTDREEIIALHGKVDLLNSGQDTTNKNIEKLIQAIENLETNRIRDIENRVTELEKWKSGWFGVMKFVSIVGIVATIISVIIAILKMKIFMMLLF